MNTAWEPVIGLEVHVQLATQSKLFSGSATAYGAEPNTQASWIDLGYPGVLPVLNRTAVDMAIKFGLAIGAQIHPSSSFARKSYFYPDLPKGYQISQFQDPIVYAGHLTIATDDAAGMRDIRITRAHLEEDAGKSLHEVYPGKTGLDLNRAGSPLLEIVSEPELYSAKEAIAYLKTLHALVRYLGISDGNMQEGSFRCDVNISLRPAGTQALGTRAEIKNVNSFRYIEKAILYEMHRQSELLARGEAIEQETRLFDPQQNVTRSLRSKESAQDYRYFSDPDLLPIAITPEHIEAIRLTLPELPQAKCKRFTEQYGLQASDAQLITQSADWANYYEESVKSAQQACPQSDLAKPVANWLTGELAAAMNKHHVDIEEQPVSATQLGILVARIADHTISGKIAKTVFEHLWGNTHATVDDIIAKNQLQQMADKGAITQWVCHVLDQHPEEIKAYHAGKTRLFGFFVGQVMKTSSGKANPQEVNACLQTELEARKTQE